ncbi:MAG TPA: aminodeoxychorismate synthase component I [Geobacteraceae bacterium]|nr:aminodeoxychorismate synthase component I [Geobacteraceae bacterium]
MVSSVCEAPCVLLDAAGAGDFGRSWRFSGYVETLQALESAEIAPLLSTVEASAADGLHAVGFISYEAATGLNPDLPAVPPLEGLPLAWFALFRERTEAAAGEEPVPEPAASPILKPDLGPGRYLDTVGRIQEYIARGDTYQVNYTFGMNGVFSGDPLRLYREIARGQRASFNAYIDTGRFAVISASPELFFSLKDRLIRVRPMKGTARRGRWAEEDGLQVSRLKGSPKERAENLMIVDLLRNDLGIVAETGSVKVESLFEVETYPTLHQMTSTVSATVREGVGLAEIMAALFPCGSVTGAPKRRSMEIVEELESGPRGVYCGAVGYVAPGGEALFSVAIRTLLYDRGKRQLSLGIGSGITTDSVAQDEYLECMTKAGFLFPKAEDFCLIESLRLENGAYSLLERHLERLRNSARYFGFTLDEEAVKVALGRQSEGKSGVHKVRLLAARNGEFALSSEPLASSDSLLKFVISDRRVDSTDVFRFHKTTCRDLLDSARAERPGVDEVVFLNERGELAEGSYHSLLLRINGTMMTPKLDSGLLPGVMRQELLERGEAVESTLFASDLAKTDEIWLINSVRGMRRAVYVEGEST